MANFHTLPQEVRLRILLHLSPTSIFALRQICKSWNNVLSSSDTERAISSSLLFSSTAPDLKSRLLRRQRLLRADPVQISYLDGDFWNFFYYDGHLVAVYHDERRSKILGFWSCRKETYGRVATINIHKLVKQLYPKLWGCFAQADQVTKAGDHGIVHCCPHSHMDFLKVRDGVVTTIIRFGDKPNASKFKFPGYIFCAFLPYNTHMIKPST